MKVEQSVPKRRHIKFKRREIIQKKEYDRCRYVHYVQSYNFFRINRIILNRAAIYNSRCMLL